MMFKPWDCAQPDEWLPQRLRLCWGGGGDGGGGGFSGDGGGGWDGSGGGMGNTGGGDWGSAGMYDASGFNAGGDLGAWAGTAYDASTAGTGMGGGGDWGSFSTASFPDSTPGAIFTDVAGPNPGVTTGGGDWGSAGAFSAAGTGGGPGGAMFGAAQGAGAGLWGGGDTGGGGFYGDTGGGGGGSAYGGGGQQGGGSFGGFGTAGTAGGRASVTDSTPGYVGSVSGGKDVTQDAPNTAPTTSQAQIESVAAPTKGEAQIESAGDPDATDPDASPSDFGTPQAAPEAEAQPEAAPAISSTIASGRETNFDYGPQAAPAEQEAAPSHFGPESVTSQEGRQALSDLTQSALAPDVNWGAMFEGAPSAQNVNWGAMFEAPSDPGYQPDAREGPMGPIAEPGWFQSLISDIPGVENNPSWGQNTPSLMEAMQPGGPLSGLGKAYDFLTNTLPGTLNPNDWSIYGPTAYALDQQAAGEQGKATAYDGPFAGPDVVGDRAGQSELSSQLGIENVGAPQGLDPGAEQYGVEATPAPDLATQLGIENIDPTNWGSVFEGAPSAQNVDWASVFEGAAPALEGLDPGAEQYGIEARTPTIEAFIPAAQETNFDYARSTTDPVTGQPSVDTTMESGPAVAPTTTDTAATKGGDPALSGLPANPTFGAPSLDYEGSPYADMGREADQSIVSRGDWQSLVQDPGAYPAVNLPTVPSQLATPDTVNWGAVFEGAAPPPEGEGINPGAEQYGFPTGPEGIDPGAEQYGFQPTPEGINPGAEQYGFPTTTAPPPSLIEQAQTGLPPPALTPTVQPSDAPQQQPAPAAQPPADEDEADPHTNTPAQPGARLGTPTTGKQNTPVVTSRVIQEQQGKTRDRPVSEALHGILTRAAEQADVVVRIGSGGQIATRDRSDKDRQGGWTGSVRHNHGNAADVQLEKDGRILSFNNPNDRPIMEAFVREAARLGATGQGAGMAYMKDKTIHVGFGGTNFWKADNEGSRALRQAWREGLQGPANRPPADIPTRQAQAIPLPGRRPADAPQQEAATPPARPPADVPAALPPQAPQETRPPADIPAPTLSPPRAGRLDTGLQARFANDLLKDATKNLNKNSGEAEFQAASVVAAKALAAAGIPAAMARSLMAKGAYEGAAKNGYDINSFPMGGVYKSKIDGGIDAALQGYQPAKPGAVQGPPSPSEAPGKQGALPSGQQYADLSQSLGSGNAYGRGVLGREGDVGAASPYFGALAPTMPELSPLIKQAPGSNGWQWSTDPPLDTPTPGQFSPYRGNEAALPSGQQFADLSQSLGPARQGDVGAPSLQQLSPLTAPPAAPPTWGQPPAPPPPPQYRPGDPGMFNPFRGNEARELTQPPDPNAPPPDPNAPPPPPVRGGGRTMQAEAAPSLMDMLGNVLSNFNPISTAEAKGRGRDGALQQALDLAREGGNLGGQRGMSVIGKNVFTFYAPGASGSKGMEGPMIGSKGNPLTTLDDVRDGAGFVSLAGHPNQFGQQVFIGNITYTSPVDGKQYTLNNVVGRVDDTGGKFGGRDNPDQNHFDIAVGNFSRGWNDRTAGSFVASNYATAVPGRGIGSDYAADDQGTLVGAQPPAEAPPAAMRGLAKGGHVAKDEPVVVGEEGPEVFVPDWSGTVVPHMPQPGKTGKSENIDRWPKVPAPNFPGRYGGVEREMLRQTREAQNPMPSLMDLVDSGRLPLNAANWHAMLNDPDLIALGRSRMGTVDAPAPAPAAEPPDPTNQMAQALGYGSIKRRPMQIGRQSY